MKWHKSLQEPEIAVTIIRLGEDLEVPLEQLAKKLDRGKNCLVNQAIKEKTKNPHVARRAAAEPSPEAQPRTWPISMD